MVICNENYSRLQLSPPHFYLSTALFSIVVGFFVVKYNSFIYGGSNNIRRLKSINRVNFSLASLRNLLPSLPPPFDRGNVAALGRDATEGIRRKSVRRKSVLRPRSSPRRRCRYRFSLGIFRACLLFPYLYSLHVSEYKSARRRPVQTTVPDIIQQQQQQQPKKPTPNMKVRQQHSWAV